MSNILVIFTHTPRRRSWVRCAAMELTIVMLARGHASKARRRHSSISKPRGFHRHANLLLFAGLPCRSLACGTGDRGSYRPCSWAQAGGPCMNTACRIATSVYEGDKCPWETVGIGCSGVCPDVCGGNGNCGCSYPNGALPPSPPMPPPQDIYLLSFPTLEVGVRTALTLANALIHATEHQ